MRLTILIRQINVTARVNWRRRESPTQAFFPKALARSGLPARGHALIIHRVKQSVDDQQRRFRWYAAREDPPRNALLPQQTLTTETNREQVFLVTVGYEDQVARKNRSRCGIHAAMMDAPDLISGIGVERQRRFG